MEMARSYGLYWLAVCYDGGSMPKAFEQRFVQGMNCEYVAGWILTSVMRRQTRLIWWPRSLGRGQICSLIV